jgi:opacity protein-like surface antigen
MAGIAILLSATSNVMGEDKGQYSLFNPTPDRRLREMTTDRPDTTESAFTVNAGRIQIESNLFGYARSRPDHTGAVNDSREFANTNVRVGVTNNAEVGFVWQPHGMIRTRQGDPAATYRAAGVGGFELRAKFNLWGNDAFEPIGASALALLPFITLPTDRDNGISPEAIEGGLVVPIAIKLSDKFGLGLNAGVTYVRADTTKGYHPEYVTSASLSYEWNEKLGTYYEVAARFHTEDPRGDAVVLGTGFTYRLTKNVQLDAGINFGITSAADRINPFVGLSTRF